MFGTDNIKRLMIIALFWFMTMFTGNVFGDVPGADTLTVSTYHYTRNWHPVKSESYPAAVIAKLTTERLFDRKCMSFDPDVSRNPALCQDADRDVDEQHNLLVLDLDNARCPGLKPADVEFTIEQIRDTPFNDFYMYDLRIIGRRIHIGRPVTLNKAIAKKILSFPLLRSPDPGEIVNDVIRDAGTYNRMTNGCYKIDRFHTSAASLSIRPGGIYDRPETKIKRMILSYIFIKDRLLAEMMTPKKKPDIVLAVPSSFPVPESYKSDEIPDLNSFIYMGFNYKTGDESTRRLFRNVQFRKLMTFSLWTQDTIERKFMSPEADGIFIGQSFDADHPEHEDRMASDALIRAINEFLRGVTFKKELEVLLSPSVIMSFDEADLENIQKDLDRLWNGKKSGFTFKFNWPDRGRDGFIKDKNNPNAFDMIFDTFFYRENKRQYMAFVQQDNHTFNFLGVDEKIFVQDDFSKKFLDEEDQGRKDFQEEVNKQYPVAVIGHFSMRNLFSINLDKGDECGKKGISMPFYNIHTWVKHPAP